MKISGQYSTNFGAKLISRTNIKKYEGNDDKYKDYKASFIEIDPKNKNDRRAMSDAVYYWKSDSYGMNVVARMDDLAKNEDDNPADKIYAITTQKDRFSKLDSDRIEAVAHVFETNKRVQLVYLQVNPDLIYGWKNPDYKYVGKGMIDSLKDKYHDRSIILVPSKTAEKFYEKQGFEYFNDGENRMIWNKQAEEQSEYKDEYW